MSQIIIPPIPDPGPALVKGTQGATGYSVQDLKDSGRVNISWTLDGFVTTAAAEGLMTMTESRDGAATTTFSSKTITNGKRLRLTSLSFAISPGGSTPATSRVHLRVRVNSAGATTTASPIQGIYSLTHPATAKTTVGMAAQFPDGIEFAGDGTRSIGFTIQSVDWVTTTNLPVVYITITGFEY